MPPGVRTLEYQRARFMEKVVEDENGCWIYQHKLRPDGTRSTGRPNDSRNLAYVLFIGPMPGQGVLHHTCKNPQCVRPEHQEVLTGHEHGQAHSEEYQAGWAKRKARLQAARDREEQGKADAIIAEAQGVWEVA